MTTNWECWTFAYPSSIAPNPVSLSEISPPFAMAVLVFLDLVGQVLLPSAVESIFAVELGQLINRSWYR